MNTNSTKVWFLIVASSIAHLFVGYWLGQRVGLLLGFFAALFFNLIVFLYGESRLLSFFKAEPLKGQDAWGLNELNKKLSQQLQINPPKIYVADSPLATLFSVSHSWGRHSICVTSELLSAFNQNEIHTLFIHQLCHIQRIDTFAMSVGSTIANSVVGLGDLIDQMTFRRPVFSHILAPFGWLIVKIFTPKKLFFENDTLSTHHIEDVRLLGDLLWKLQARALNHPIKVPPCTNHLFVVNPEGSHSMQSFRNLHPPMPERIHHLLGYYPL